jgi:hypothetical protein
LPVMMFTVPFILAALCTKKISTSLIQTKFAITYNSSVHSTISCVLDNTKPLIVILHLKICFEANRSQSEP